MRDMVALLLLAACVAASGFAQQKRSLRALGEDKPEVLLPRDLEISSSKPIRLPAFGWYGDSQCTTDGDIFLHAGSGTYNYPVILKISSDGQSSKLYELSSKEVENNAFTAFSVTPAGRVWLLTEDRKGGANLFGFNSNGHVSVETHLELPENLELTGVVVFESGTSLVTGFFTRHAEEKIRGTRFVGLFESSGKIIKQLNSANDPVDLKKLATAPAEGAVSIGPDGNAYLLNSKEIVVMSESGGIVRRFSYSKPTSGMIARRIAVSQNLIALWLLGRGKNDIVVPEFLVMNRETGDVIGLYTPTEEFGNNAVCFSAQDGFTFIKKENTEMRFLTALMK
jgi:hypothetical protein